MNVAVLGFDRWTYAAFEHSLGSLRSWRARSPETATERRRYNEEEAARLEFTRAS
jgi:hypothetical protein